MVDRTLLFVVGMHRSGTSAMCAALAACGACFGERLLGAMAGVNDEGFWEDERVVALNERLLESLGVTWFSVHPGGDGIDWGSQQFDSFREEAAGILRQGFGEGALEALKDPRLCITLPFWLQQAEALSINARVLVCGRAPLEVAHSLHKRDAFPLAFGLRLCASYRQFIADNVPGDTLCVSYDELLSDPVALLKRLAGELPLVVNREALDKAVRSDLRHQRPAESDASLLARADTGDLDLVELWRLLDEEYPLQQTLDETISALVQRGDQLTRIGDQHTLSLATVQQRDAEIEALCAEHKQELATIDEHLQRALATIAERDGQISDFDRRLSKLGEEHSYALDLIRSRDEQLQRVFAKPGIGYLFRAMWKHESR